MSPPSATFADLDADERAAPPRSNGELVFAAPWESRAFGLAATLAEAGVFGWDDFRVELSATIAAWERDRQGDWSYYTCWLDALEAVLVGRDLMVEGEVAGRAIELTQRPAGHDHDHDHSHGHDH